MGRAQFGWVAVLVSMSVLVVAPTAGAQAAGSGAPEAGSSDWRQVSAGTQHTCGVRTSGRLFCWGDDRQGQLGDDAARVDKATPVEVFAP